MYRTFNCGVGMVLVVNSEDGEHAIELLTSYGETAWKIGEVVSSSGQADVTIE